jgi:hypothetical protein
MQSGHQSGPKKCKMVRKFELNLISNGLICLYSRADGSGRLDQCAFCPEQPNKAVVLSTDNRVKLWGSNTGSIIKLLSEDSGFHRNAITQEVNLFYNHVARSTYISTIIVYAFAFRGLLDLILHPRGKIY